MKRHRQNKARKRGAALVEATVVLPVLLAFFTLMTYVHKSYSQKLSLVESAHNDVLTRSLPGCKSGAEGGSLGPSCGTGGPDNGFFSTSSTRTGTVAVGRLSRTIKAEAHFMCNTEVKGGSAEQAGGSVNASTSPAIPSPTCD
jgi:hypothetical protein